MEFDVVIIGGGLAGLTAGLALQEKGKRTAIVSAGQNALHFSSGAFGLLDAEDPLQAAKELPEHHPYARIGAENLPKYTEAAKALFGKAGIALNGEPLKNGWRLTPQGGLKRAWMTLPEVDIFPDKEAVKGHKVLIVNLLGYLDFNTSFLALGLEKQGCSCRIETLRLPEMERLRENPSEMRSVNIARVMDSAWIKVAAEIKTLVKDEDWIILPQVFGLKDATVPDRIREAVPAKVLFVGTMPPSVPGMRTQMQLKKAYEALGGTFQMGDEAISAKTEGSRVLSVSTRNLGEVKAAEFVLATGSYFSKGIASDMNHVFEPLFGVDVLQDEGRSAWYDPDFFSPQAFLSYGVATDGQFRVLKDQAPMDNLHAVGSVLGGARSLELGCGAGVAILTALSVAEMI